MGAVDATPAAAAAPDTQVAAPPAATPAAGAAAPQQGTRAAHLARVQASVDHGGGVVRVRLTPLAELEPAEVEVSVSAHGRAVDVRRRPVGRLVPGRPAETEVSLPPLPPGDVGVSVALVAAGATVAVTLSRSGGIGSAGWSRRHRWRSSMRPP
jgi:hypothetical protein